MGTWLYYLKVKKLISILISSFLLVGCSKQKQLVIDIPRIDYIVSTYNCEDGNYMKYRSGDDIITLDVNSHKVLHTKRYSNEDEMLRLLDVEPRGSAILTLIPDIKATTIPYKYQSDFTISSRYIATLFNEGYVMKEYIFTSEYIDMILYDANNIMRIIITEDYIRKYDNVSKINMSSVLYINEE